MPRTTTLIKIVGVSAVLMLASAACTADASTVRDSEAAVPSDVTTLNGQVPPERVMPLRDQKQMLRTSDGQGNTILVARGTRPAHSRSPIHIHAHGGTTCVLEGQMTLYMEDMEPMDAPAGACYFMPPGPVMSGVNTGETDAVIIDSFTFPEGTQPWNVVEPNTDGADDQFDL